MCFWSLSVGYYGTSVLDFRHRDQLLVGDLAPEKQREDAFWVSQRGQAELKGKRDTKRRLLIQDREGDEFTKEQQKTEQGRKMLELEKVQRSLRSVVYTRREESGTKERTGEERACSEEEQSSPLSL